MLHPWDMLPSSVTDEYGHAGSSTPTPHKRLPWNKGKLTGAKPPLRPKHVWSVQIEGRARDLTMFNLAIDSKLRGCNRRMNGRFAPQAVIGHTPEAKGPSHRMVSSPRPSYIPQDRRSC